VITGLVIAGSSQHLLGLHTFERVAVMWRTVRRMDRLGLL